MRVLVAMPFAEAFGGAERLLLSLLDHPQEHRFDPIVVFQAEGPMIEQVRDRGVDVALDLVARFNHPRDALQAVRSARAVLRREQPDAVLSWYARSHLYYGPAAATLGRRRPAVAWFQQDVRVRMRLERAVSLLPADVIVCNSLAVQRAQAELRPRRRTTVVHPGIDVATPDAGEVARCREALALPAGALVAGLVGRAVAWKGHHRFIEAIALLRGRGVDAVGVVVGGQDLALEPEYAPQLPVLAERLGVAEHVRFTGQVADARVPMSLMDVVVNASQAEPFGMTLTEAMALGRPVVAAAAGGPLEIVVDGVTGVLTPDASPPRLADALERLAGDDDLRRRMGEAGRDRVEEHFTAGAMARNFGAAMRSLQAAR